ncbi:MAG: hypothetical protein HOP07_08440 [Bacteriovoracaceae bacterium]|nr:hypothetical protein [Bacteriovoracaceae bacterium]
MMTVQFTCKNCGSGIHVYPSVDAHKIACDVCQVEQVVKFNKEHEEGNLHDCPSCERKDFYSQKDFNRKLGVMLFVLAAIISTVLLWFGINPLWYLSTFVFLYLLDFILFRRLKLIAICYKCQTVFREVSNIQEIQGFNHEMNDRIVYSNHDFQGKPLDH